jgi:hypothetical protein
MVRALVMIEAPALGVIFTADVDDDVSPLDERRIAGPRELEPWFEEHPQQGKGEDFVRVEWSGMSDDPHGLRIAAIFRPRKALGTGAG